MVFLRARAPLQLADDSRCNIWPHDRHWPVRLWTAQISGCPSVCTSTSSILAILLCCGTSTLISGGFSRQGMRSWIWPMTNSSCRLSHCKDHC